MTLHRALVYVMTLFSVLIALMSFRFLGLGLEMAFSDMIDHIEARRLAFLLHVTFAPLALITGAVQLFPKVRARHPLLHRWTGRTYGVAVLFAGVSGLVLASGAMGGIVPGLGFGILSVLWIVTTAQGVRFARMRQFAEHRRWMIRSFALTFAAVTLRLYLPFFFANGFDYAHASVFVAWLCWVPNLMVVEWWLRREMVLA